MPVGAERYVNADRGFGAVSRNDKQPKLKPRLGNQKITVAQRRWPRKCVGASVVADVDAAPVPTATEHVVDLVMLAVEDGIVRDRDLAVALRRDARSGVADGECVAQPAAVIALVSDQLLGRRQGPRASMRHPCSRSSGLR